MHRFSFRRSVPHNMWVLGSFLLILAFVFGLSSSSRAAGPSGPERWISFSGGAASSPDMVLLSSAAGSIDLKAEFSGVTAEDIKMNGTIFTRFSGESLGVPQIVGLPELPVYRRQVEIPYGAQVQVEVIAAAYRDVSLEDLGISTPYPQQPSLSKMQDEQETQPFEFDGNFYANGSLYPAGPISALEPYVMRGRTMVMVEAWPMAYDPASRSMRLYTEIKFRLKLSGGDVEGTRRLADRYAAPAFDHLFAQDVLNYNFGRAQSINTMQGYLIIVADEYYAALQPFVELLNSYDFDVTVTKTSEIPAGATFTNIKAYIQTAYDTWPLPPSYVLFVGDTNTIPTGTGEMTGASTDLYYVTMDGEADWHPDIGRGRFPVRSAAQTTNMVNKYIAYSQLTGEEEWVKKAAFPATCDNYTVAEGTHNYVIDTHTTPHDYYGRFPNDPQPGGDELYCVTRSATQADVIEAVNDGREMVIYSGHGSYSGWELLDQSAIPGFVNYGMFPFVAGHACLNGDYGQTEVFGETWVLQPDKGAIAFWGTSSYSYWDEDDVLERGAFDRMFGDDPNKADATEMTYAGLTEVETHYAGSARYYWELYNLLGDPGMFIFTEPRFPTFSIDPAETEIEICKPDSTSFDVDVSSVMNYSSTVTLSISSTVWSPEIFTVFEPVSAEAPFTSTFTLTVGSGAVSGEYPFEFVGTGSLNETKKAGASLTIYDGVPAAPELNNPPDGAVNQPLAPSFDWENLESASSFRYQLAENPFFESPVQDVSGLESPSYELTSPLSPQTCYWWRAGGDNTCGSSDWADPYFFLTQAVVLFDNMENGTGLWAEGGTSSQWDLSTSQSHTPTHSYFTPDADATSDTWIYNTDPFIPANGTTLSFWHMYAFEGSDYDGAVLEISADGGVTYTDLSPYITSNGYNGTISSCCSNPLGGRDGWVDDLGEWTKVTVNLTSFAGQNVLVRWRLGTDSSIGDTGWYIDDVEVTGEASFGDAPVIEGVTPISGSNQSPTPITLTGQYFSEPVYLKLGEYYLADVTYIDANTIQAVVPSGLPAGSYTLTLYNGDCQHTELVGAFTVTEEITLSIELPDPGPVVFNHSLDFSVIVTGTAPFTYSWEFLGAGSGIGFDTATPTYTFTSPGRYEVTVTVQDTYGHSAAASLWVNVVDIKYFLPLVTK